jgi:hypothetical protein
MYTQQIEQEIVTEPTFEAMQDLCSIMERRPGEHYSKITEPLRFELSSDRKGSYRRAIEYLMDHDIISEMMIRREVRKEEGGRRKGRGRNRAWEVRSRNLEGEWRGSPLELAEYIASFSNNIKDYMKLKFRGAWEGSPKATINFTEYGGEIIGYLMRVPSEYGNDFGSPKREESYVWNNGLWVPPDRKMRQSRQ